MTVRIPAVTVFCLAVAAAATAQTEQATSNGPMVVDTRPATTTFLGDTGLWFVPTAEILPNERFSVSGYRTNWDYQQGQTDLSHFIGTFAFGIRDRVELFGSIRVDTRIDRDHNHPIFDTDPAVGGVLDDYPFIRQDWLGDNFGDSVFGAKVNVLSEGREAPVALAGRTFVKLPTGSSQEGVSTGKLDWGIDGIVSKDVHQVVELSGTAGVVLRLDPDGVDLNDLFTWGVGAGFPTRAPVRVFTELFGQRPFGDVIVRDAPLVAGDGSQS
ncbi:MAG: hypothetical protein HYX76_13975, partial [Acidobacteria bacterium]|nr:hypothetical protein [Acidobacteriota bacterium]